jgi:hypothetical protein
VVVVSAGVTATQRDLAVLRWVGEQYAVPMRVLACLPVVRGKGTDGSAEVLARRTAARLERLGYADRRPLLGQRWLIPSARGLRFAGLAYDRWEPSGWVLGHVEAVARVRLHLEAAYPGAGWESERAIRRRWHGSGARVRIADGGLALPDGRVVGVEVELHVKRQDRYDAAWADRDPAWRDGVWWFTPPAGVELLRARLAAAGADGHEVRELPGGVAS